ncbi:class I SAM-dependent methyltransferase [Nocardia bovistercoris]|nr:SAM-dependent methyltransferase [Nocardia bovistercoris]
MAVARARAYHQVADEPRVFTDPLAVRIIGESGLRADEFDRGIDEDIVRRRRLMIAARSRFADDVVARAVDRGVDQVVILGAGLDTTAYRDTRSRVRYFEVDHPDTQGWKRRRLAETGIEIPPSLTFAPIDFEESTLATGLAEAGLDRTRGAVFVWLGVAMYLTKASIDDTLGYIAGHGDASEVVFDYIYPAAPAADEASARRQARADRVAAAGEPWLSFFTADEIRHTLSTCGFEQVRDRSAAEVLDGYGIRTVMGPADSVVHLIHASKG